MSQAANGIDVLANAENVKSLSKIIKNNVAACTSIGAFHLPQLGRVFLDMLGLYGATSGIISEMIARGGTPTLLKLPGGSHRFHSEFEDQRRMRRLRIVKKEILKLIETFIKNLRDEDLEPINDNFLTPLLDAILSDYGGNVPMARDAEVLNITAIVMERFGVGPLHLFFFCPSTDFEILIAIADG
jgi:exportin-1